ncbi:hypothetical protein QJQ45_015017 [Haematococcus lacustris]|nr:hypothetical protein QJQ45_015017 [Haematococcus lacustris]
MNILKKMGRPMLRSILIAQILSFLLCITGITSGVLADRGINAPTTQSLLNYLLLAVTCGAVQLYRHGLRPLSNPWYIYLVLAFLDVEANYLVTKVVPELQLLQAYQYTSITSVTLLDCFTVPVVMFLTWLLFRQAPLLAQSKTRYGAGHLAGAGLCIAGLSMLVLTDRQSETGGPQPLLGDVLVLLGACVYAVCNVAQARAATPRAAAGAADERVLVDTPAYELLAMLGVCGAGVASVQAVVLERDAWHSSSWDARSLGALVGFAAALFCFYVLVPLVLKWGGSTVLNLSLLTSDLWAAGARALLFHGFGGTAPYFAVALVAEASGILVYSLAGPTTTATCHQHPHQPLGSKLGTEPGPPSYGSDEAQGADDDEEAASLLPKPALVTTAGQDCLTRTPDLPAPASTSRQGWKSQPLLAPAAQPSLLRRLADAATPGGVTGAAGGWTGEGRETGFAVPAQPVAIVGRPLTGEEAAAPAWGSRGAGSLGHAGNPSTWPSLLQARWQVVCSRAATYASALSVSSDSGNSGASCSSGGDCAAAAVAATGSLHSCAAAAAATRTDVQGTVGKGEATGSGGSSCAGEVGGQTTTLALACLKHLSDGAHDRPAPHLACGQPLGQALT